MTQQQALPVAVSPPSLPSSRRTSNHHHTNSSSSAGGLIRVAFVALLLSVLLGTFHFIGSVVVKSFQFSSGSGGVGLGVAGAGGGARLKTHVEKRGRPAGGAAMEASAKKLEGATIQTIRPDDNAPAAMHDGNAGAINYYLHPSAFTDIIVNCMSDPNCRIIYHHVGKSGGTTIEEVFYTLYPPKLKSCCGPKLMGKLATNSIARTQYCTAKFSSYQILGKYMEGLATSCMFVNNGGKRKGNDIKSRTVILTSFREPIQRCLSSIHQMCNKNLDGRSNATLMACRECKYDVDNDQTLPVWDKVINMTLDHYAGVEFVTKLRLDNVRVVSIDMLDINSFFDRLRVKLKPSGLDVPETPWRNPERKSVCSFSMPSEMMKLLAPAQSVYRNLTSGV